MHTCSHIHIHIYVIDVYSLCFAGDTHTHTHTHTHEHSHAHTRIYSFGCVLIDTRQKRLDLETLCSETRFRNFVYSLYSRDST